MNKENRDYKYEFTEQIVNENIAKEIEDLIVEAVENARIPFYKTIEDIPIVHDGIQYVFGNEKTPKFGTIHTPIESETIIQLIKLSDKLIKKNYKKIKKNYAQ